MKKVDLKKGLLLLTVVLAIPMTFAQNTPRYNICIDSEIIGANEVEVNQPTTYRISTSCRIIIAEDQATEPGEGMDWWISSNGILNKSEHGESVTLTFTQPGTYTLYFDYDETYRFDFSKQIKVNPPPITIPSTPPNPVLLEETCEAPTITRSGSPGANTQWYWQTSPSGTSTHLGFDATLTIHTTGDYYLRARSTQYGETAWSTHSSRPISVYVAPCPTFDDENYVHTTHYQKPYSESELATVPINEKVETITYFNALGKATQTQTFDAKTERIWARQILYDSQGRPALQTLSAPISDRDKTTPETFQYKEDFIRNKAGVVFTSADFEGSPALEENPKEVQSRANTYDLGRQYSAHNTEEQWQDITTRPYTRTLYSTLNPGSVLKTIGGNKIDTNADGVGDAWKQGFSYTFPAAQEMYYAFGYDYFEYDPSILDAYPGAQVLLDNIGKDIRINLLKATKTVAQDIHGVETVVFADTDGKTLATARAGGAQKYEVLSLIGTQKYVDIHIPVGCQNTLSFVGGSRSDFRIYDLRTEALVTTPNLNAGFYRVEYLGDTALSTTGSLTRVDVGTQKIEPLTSGGFAGVRYQVNYYEYALHYYDRAGRLVKSTQPLGFDRTALEGLKTQAQCTHSLATTFVYNALGQLTETTSPDEGTTEFLYRKDGQIRFSRNSKQRGSDKVIESNFTADFGGWVANGSTNPVIENGRLSVHVDASWEGIKHELKNFEVAQGQKYRMKIKFDKGNTQSAVRLYVQERDADKNHLRWRMMSSDLQTGEHEFTYTVGSDAKKIILRLDKQNTNLDTETQFYVDYASFHRVYNDAKEFSYTHYDDLGRPVESGVARNQFTTENTARGNNAMGFGNFNLVATSIPFAEMDPDSTSPIYNTKAEEKQETFYDLADAHHLEAALGEALRSYYTQTFVAGNVSKTQNEQTTTWYSYDIYGRVRWIVQKIKGLGVKTIDYEYHPVSGAVTQVDFQKHHSAERFVHRYTYHPISGELLSVATSEDGSNFTEQADYTYYETGALKRLALKNSDGAVLQGIDYTYNLAGQLKAINHPDLQEGNDPGGDANDAFGMRIDYYQGDYQRANAFESTPENAQGIDQYNGNIKAVTWSTRNQLDKQTYYYQYNKNNGLEAASLGTPVNELASVATTVVKNTPISATETTTASHAIVLKPGFHAVASENLAYEAKIESNTINNDDYAVYGLSYDANGNLQTLNRNKNTENNRNAMDQLSYVYKTDKPNQLLRVEDSVAEETHANDIKNQEGNNYRYNSIGQLIENAGEGLKYRYNAAGLVTEVQKNNVTLIKIYYNDKGFRVRKESYNNQTGDLQSTQYYVRDVSGNVMAIYEGQTQVELPVYGASRLGVYKKGSHTNYELTDHLGNVRAVVAKDNPTPSLFVDYYPGGMPMPGRNIVGDYRYNYQGQELDPETGKVAFQLRLYDPRINRWLTTDPYGQFSSPYLSMGNNWIRNIDPDGGTCYDADGGVLPCNDIGVSGVHDVDLGGGYNADWDVIGLDEVFVSNNNDWRSADLQYSNMMEVESMMSNMRNMQQEFGAEFSEIVSVVNPWTIASAIPTAITTIDVSASLVNSSRAIIQQTDDVLLKASNKGNSLVNEGKAALIESVSKKIVPKLSYSMKREIIKRGIREKTLKFMMKQHDVINPDNIVKTIDFLTDAQKIRGGI